MSATHPTFSAAGPDATYTPATYNDTDLSFAKGVNPAVWLAGQLNAMSVSLYTVGTTTGGTGYNLNDLVGLVTKYDPSTKLISSFWQNFTTGLFPSAGPAAGSTFISPLMGIPAGEAHIGAVGGGATEVKVQWNRPAGALAYNAGALMGRTSAVSNPVDGSGNALIVFGARISNAPMTIRRARMWKSGTSLTNASFALHLFEEVPTISVGDGGIFNASPTSTGGVLAVDRTRFRAGKIPIIMDTGHSDGCSGIGTPVIGSDIILNPAFGTKAFYVAVEAVAGYSAAANEAFGLTIELYQE